MYQLNQNAYTPYYKALSSDLNKKETYELLDTSQIPSNAFFVIVSGINIFSKDEDTTMNSLIQFHGKPGWFVANGTAYDRIVFDSIILERDPSLKNPREFMRRFAPYVVYGMYKLMINKDYFRSEIDKTTMPLFSTAKYLGSDACAEYILDTTELVEGTIHESTLYKMHTMKNFNIEANTNVSKMMYFLYRESALLTNPTVI